MSERRTSSSASWSLRKSWPSCICAICICWTWMIRRASCRVITGSLISIFGVCASMSSSLLTFSSSPQSWVDCAGMLDACAARIGTTQSARPVSQASEFRSRASAAVPAMISFRVSFMVPPGNRVQEAREGKEFLANLRNPPEGGALYHFFESLYRVHQSLDDLCSVGDRSPLRRC